MSEPGNLYASLLLTDAAPAAHLPELCFVVALAVRDAVACGRAASLRSRLKLKWPNDLLLDGAKLAGILIEAESVGGKTVDGGGHRRELRAPSRRPCLSGDQSCRPTARRSAPESCSRELSRAMVARLAQWDRGAGFAAIRAEWLTHAAGIGGDIQVRLPDRELTGTFESLDRMGRLMLRLPGRRA